ncbi:hypothetical protein F5888DRAFT_1693645 [Russula emetica]|nr:hypothetical protein F5888DRAFT_1693645 [Russula emetica]
MQVHEPEQRNSLHLSARRSLEASESSQIVNASDADDQDIELEAPGRGHESTLNELPPPLGVKLTGYKLLNMSVMLTFTTTEAILAYTKRPAVISTWLDWIAGGFLGAALYWIGQYEPLRSSKWEWFFQVDLMRAICYCVLRFIGGGEEDLCLLLCHRY